MCVYDTGAWSNALRELSDLPDQIRKQGSRTPEQQATANEIAERIETIIATNQIPDFNSPKYEVSP
jgi:hypothetical protein